jgi:hypothetical protein
MYISDYSCPNCGALLYSEMWLESELIPFDKNAAAICKGCNWAGAVGEVRMSSGLGPQRHDSCEYVPDYQI